MVCLHGILGSKKNWRTPSNIFTKKYPQFQAITMDHRGHGSSPKVLPGENTVESCALDVLRTLKNGELPTIFKSSPPTLLCGHSYSGKVVLSILDILIKSHAPLPEHVWILDSMPGHYDRALDASHQQSVSGIISTIMALPAQFESKEWVESLLASKGIPKSVIDWLSTNIVPVEGADGEPVTPKAFRYSFDISTVQYLFDDFCDMTMWEFLEHYQGSAMIHFIRAGKNRAWTKETLDRFAQLSTRNPRIKLHTMPHVGHWLHAEDVHGLVDLVATESGIKAVA
jgi:pimeloyl-ACP methyl ester carboxylesterase